MLFRSVLPTNLRSGPGGQEGPLPGPGPSWGPWQEEVPLLSKYRFPAADSGLFSLGQWLKPERLSWMGAGQGQDSASLPPAHTHTHTHTHTHSLTLTDSPYSHVPTYVLQSHSTHMHTTPTCICTQALHIFRAHSQGQPWSAWGCAAEPNVHSRGCGFQHYLCCGPQGRGSFARPHFLYVDNGTSARLWKSNGHHRVGTGDQPPVAQETS